MPILKKRNRCQHSCSSSHLERDGSPSSNMSHRTNTRIERAGRSFSHNGMHGTAEPRRGQIILVDQPHARTGRQYKWGVVECWSSGEASLLASRASNGSRSGVKPSRAAAGAGVNASSQPIWSRSGLKATVRWLTPTP